MFSTAIWLVAASCMEHGSDTMVMYFQLVSAVLSVCCSVCCSEQRRLDTYTAATGRTCGIYCCCWSRSRLEVAEAAGQLALFLSFSCPPQDTAENDNVRVSKIKNPAADDGEWVCGGHLACM